jgi:hypothetical protein
MRHIILATWYYTLSFRIDDKNFLHYIITQFHCKSYLHVLMLTIAGTSETRRDRVPVARAYVGVRKRNQEGEGTCGPGILVEG